jgi:hypothetical protein
MRFVLFYLSISLLVSCGMKVPFDKALQEKYTLNTDKSLRKVQFYVSETVILKKSASSGNQGTNDDGVLVTSSDKQEDRIIFPAYAKCVFDGYGPNQELLMRFELGLGKVLTFNVRPNLPNGKYYLSGKTEGSDAGKVTYGKELYDIQSSGAGAYLLVAQKKLDRTRRKDRVVRGMKV